MLQGTRLACLLLICQTLYSSRLDNLRYDMVHVPKTMPLQIKVMFIILREKEKVRA
jgi:hypothetical protein